MGHCYSIRLCFGKGKPIPVTEELWSGVVKQ